MKYTLIRFSLMLLLIAAMLSVSCSDTPVSNVKPDIIFIIIDSSRADHYSSYGYEKQTSPNIDRIAAEGTLFQNYFVNAFNTPHSVPQIFTSRYYVKPFWEIIQSNPEWKLWLKKRPDAETSLFEVLGNNGYSTKIVSAHAWLSRSSELHSLVDSLELVHSRKGQPAANFQDINEQIFPWLEEAKDKPFFLYIHAMDTHSPHVVSAPYDTFVPEGEFDITFVNNDPADENGRRSLNTDRFGERELSYFRGVYDGEILRADAGIGDLRRKLEELGVWDNSIVIITADHGEDLGEFGTISHSHIEGDCVQKVPFIIKFPGKKLNRGKRIEPMVEAIDVFPTLVDYLKLQLPEGSQLFGRSFLSLIDEKNTTYKGKERIISSTRILPDGSQRSYSVRTKDYRYVGGTFSEWQPGDRRHGQLRLYRLENGGPEQYEVDPQESSYGAIVDRMKGYLVEVEGSREQFAREGIVINRPFSMVVIPQRASPAEAMTTTGSDTDGKWQVAYTNLSASGDKENPPPITLDFEVPNGEYDVTVVALSRRTELWSASRFLFRAMGETDFREIATDQAQNRHEQYLPIGRYDIQNGMFTCEIDNIEGPYRVNLVKFIFVATSIEDALAEDEDDTTQKLKNLGYIQ